MSESYKAASLGNTGEAYRQFRSPGMLQAAHQGLVDLMRRKLVAGAIIAMAGLGLIGLVLVFFR